MLSRLSACFVYIRFCKPGLQNMILALFTFERQGYQISLKTSALLISRTNVASEGSVFNDTRKVKVLSLPETIKEKSTFRRRAFARNVDFLLLS